MPWGLTLGRTKVTERLGRRIHELRIAAGMSQDELAHAARVSRIYVSSIERGEQAATVEILAKLARGLAVPVGHLFDADERPDRGRKLPPEDLLARRVAALARGATPAQVATFEKIARAYFGGVVAARGRKSTAR